MLLRILLWPFGNVNEYGEFNLNPFGHLALWVGSVIGGILAAIVAVWILMYSLIIVFDGPEALRTPELIRDPLCFLFDYCDRG